MMRKINIVLMKEEDEFVRQYQKDKGIRLLDEAINNIIMEAKNGRK